MTQLKKGNVITWGLCNLGQCRSKILMAGWITNVLGDSNVLVGVKKETMAFLIFGSVFLTCALRA